MSDALRVRLGIIDLKVDRAPSGLLVMTSKDVNGLVIMERTEEELLQSLILMLPVIREVNARPPKPR